MLRFTEEEFQIMVEELTCKRSEEPRYDMLAQIVEKTLRNVVTAWCAQDSVLCGGGHADDLMQDLHLHFMKKTLAYFIFHKDVTSEYNNNPIGFQNWMFTVALNKKKDLVKRIVNREKKTVYIDDDSEEAMPIDIPDPRYGEPDFDKNREVIEKLQKAFSIVLSSNISVYKTLTWLAVYLTIYIGGVERIEAKNAVLEKFQKKTLGEMYSTILEATGFVPWLVITEEQNKKIAAALQKEYAGNVTYSETTYETFFMNYMGEKDGKKSASDWSNRINDIIKREFGDTDDDGKEKKCKESKKKDSDESQNGKKEGKK